MKFNLGAFNRPWNFMEVDEALTAISQAGYEYLGFLRHKGKFVLDENSTIEDAINLKNMVLKHNLKPSTLFPPLDLEGEVKASIKKFKKSIDLTSAFGAKYLLAMGSMDKGKEDKFCEIISACTEYAADQGVLLTVKPHGGISSTARECLQLIKKINSDNFKIFYDPYNIVYYNDNVVEEEDIKIIVDHICGVIIKFPRTSEVDYETIFKFLAEKDFSGPCLVESLKGETVEEINKEGKETFQYLKGIISNL